MSVHEERAHLPVGLIVVTHNPEVPFLRAILIDLSKVLEAIIVVDNGSDGVLVDELRELIGTITDATLVAHENLGIGHAQNEGINILSACGIEFALFLDQDTSMTSKALMGLWDGRQLLTMGGARIAAVGPTLGEHHKLLDAHKMKEERYIASSGSLVGLDTLREVGMFRSEYFIDHVDKEWGLRARQRGYISFRALSIEVPHRFGDNERKWLGKPRRYHTSPLRNYYLVRNEILSWRDLSYSVGEVFRSLTILFKWCFVTLIIAPSAIERLRSMALGAAHGILGRAGASSSLCFAHASIPFPRSPAGSTGGPL
ncbi:MAG: hypothetical protein VB093_12410 [Propionicimonas sp.]|nr:hypothetical protein [Propionicimonas sp.]